MEENRSSESTKTQSKGSRKLLVFLGGGLLLLLCCCVCSAVAGYFIFQSEDFKDGYCTSLDEDNSLDSDIFGLCDDWSPTDSKQKDNDDMMDQEKTEEKSEQAENKDRSANSQNYTKYDGLYFSFEYPESWEERSSATEWSTVEFVSPDGVVMRYRSIYDNDYSEGKAGCEDYAESVFSGLANVYDEVSSDTPKFMETKNGYSACYLKGYLTDGGDEMVFERYFIYDNLIESFGYELEIEYMDNQSSVESVFKHAIDTFTIKN